MAEIATASDITSSMPNPDMFALDISGASPNNTPGLPADITSTLPDEPPKALTDKLAGIKRHELDDQGRLISRMERDIATGRQRMERAFAAESFSTGDLKPWNEKEERAKYTQSPLETFGSIGSVFAIIASAFTRQPMINALNGAASAMSAVRAGNDKEYEYAYEAWQKNTDLAIKRHQMQHEAFTDAINLMNTNVQLGSAEMRVMAAKYGDEQTLALLEAGMNKEVIDLYNSRAQAGIKLAESKIELEQMDLKNRLIKGNPDIQAFKEGRGSWQAAEAALRRIGSGQFTPEEQIFADYIKENPDATAEQKATFLKSLRRNLSPAQIAVEQFLTQNPNASVQELQKFIQGINTKPDSPAALARIQEQKRHNKAMEDIAAGKLTKDQARQEEITRHNMVMENIGLGREGSAEARAAEQERHNKALEDISRAREGERERHARVIEDTTKAREAEQERRNRAVEDIASGRLTKDRARDEEASRHNRIMEDIGIRRGGSSDLRRQEIERHNQALEDISRAREGERERHDQVLEGLSSGRLTKDQARDAEIARHNKAQEDLGTAKEGSVEKRQQEIDRHNRVMEEIIKAKGDSSGPANNSQQIKARAIEEIRAAHAGMTYAEAERLHNQTIASISGNKAADMKAKISEYQVNIDEISEAETLLQKNSFTAGLAGKIGRLTERVKNVLGISSDADRVQFMRTIEYLRALGGRLSTESGSRPLSLESKGISDTIGGIDLGDTKANTLRALNKVKQLYITQQKDISNILHDTWQDPTDPASKPAEPEKPKSDWWKKY